MENKENPSIKNEPQSVEKKLWKLIPEEPASIRSLNANDILDIERYKQMDRDPETQKWMIGEEMTEEEIKEIIASHSKNRLVYAISGEKAEGELEGWVQLLPEEKERIERMRTMALIDISEDNLILELSYARYRDPNVREEEREKGLVSSGVRQVCFALGLTLNKENEKPKLNIVAYTNPANKPSERVLENSGFKKLGQMKYEPDSEKNDNVWTLDWDKLNALYRKKDEERKMDWLFDIKP